MKYIKQTADCMYHRFFRINRHMFDGKGDDIASLLIALLCFGTMWVSLMQLNGHY